MAKIKDSCEKAVTSRNPTIGTKRKAAPALKEPAQNELSRRSGPLSKNTTPNLSSSSAAARNQPLKERKKAAQRPKLKKRLKKSCYGGCYFTYTVVINGLVDSNWKAKLIGIESFIQVKELTNTESLVLFTCVNDLKYPPSTS